MKSYLYASVVMISEAALSLLPGSFHKLTPLARRGGVLTPMSALGDVLIERLGKTGRIELVSELAVENAEDSKKSA